jgi:hypothetical protein
MRKYVVPVCVLLIPLWRANSQVQPSTDGVPVEVVATASEYVPRSTTVSRPGHSYTNCLGSTDYFGEFHSCDYGYGNSGSVSGTAETTTSCKTTFSPPTEATLTTYRRVNYTIAKSDRALYLLSCTQTWNQPPRSAYCLELWAVWRAGQVATPVRRIGRPQTPRVNGPSARPLASGASTLSRFATRRTRSLRMRTAPSRSSWSI